MSHRVKLFLGDLSTFYGTFYSTGTIDAAAGGVTLTGTVEDPAYALDGLTMTWRPANDELNAPVEPLQANFRLKIRDVGLLDGLELGSTAWVRLENVLGTTVHGAVYGRVAELSASQELRGDTIWTVYDVAVVDHSATSNEPVDTTYDSLAFGFLTDELSSASGIPIRSGNLGDDLYVIGQTGGPRDTDNAGVVTVLREYLPVMPIGSEVDVDPIPRGMLQLAPIVDTFGELALLSLHVDDWREPLNTVSLDGGRVTLDGTWRRAPSAAVNTVVATIPELGVLDKVKAVARAAGWSPGDKVIRRKIDTGSLVRPFQAHADMLAAAYLPDPDDVGWSCESFRWKPESATELGTDWFPNWHSDEFSTVQDYEVSGDPSYELVADCFRTEVTITDLVEEANLAGGTTYTGRLNAVTLTLDGGDVVVDFALRRTA